MDWKVCPKCNFYIATNRAKHLTACDGTGPRSIKEKDKIKRGKAWAKGLTKNTNASIAQQSKTLSAKILSGVVAKSGFASLDYDNNKRRASGKMSGGYRENAGRSKKFIVEDSFGKQTCLQSSYELEVSIILNDLGIKWIRPQALKYDNRNYFADFYLPDVDVWLDPKNDYKAKQDEEKIRRVIEQNNVKLYVLLKHQITKEYIASLIQG